MLGSIKVILPMFLISFMCSTQTELPQRGICAHRGASSSHPENTLSAFQEAIRLGVHMIEFDVHLSKDSVLVILHDKKVNRTTNGTGLVSDLTLAELKALDAGSWKDEMYYHERIPTLKETLAMMPKNIWLNIHIRGGADAGVAAAKMIRQQKRMGQTIIACTMEVASAVKHFEKSIKICNMDRMQSSNEYVEATIKTGAEFIQLTNREDEHLGDSVDRLRRHGIKINYYRADSVDRLKELFAQGVDFPLVNDVAVMMKSIHEWAMEPVHPSRD